MERVLACQWQLEYEHMVSILVLWYSICRGPLTEQQLECGVESTTAGHSMFPRDLISLETRDGVARGYNMKDILGAVEPSRFRPSEAKISRKTFIGIAPPKSFQTNSPVQLFKRRRF